MFLQENVVASQRLAWLVVSLFFFSLSSIYANEQPPQKQQDEKLFFKEKKRLKPAKLTELGEKLLGIKDW